LANVDLVTVAFVDALPCKIECLTAQLFSTLFEWSGEISFIQSICLLEMFNSVLYVCRSID